MMATRMTIATKMAIISTMVIIIIIADIGIKTTAVLAFGSISVK